MKLSTMIIVFHGEKSCRLRPIQARDAVVPSPGKTGIATDSGKMSIAIVHSALREGNLDALC